MNQRYLTYDEYLNLGGSRKLVQKPDFPIYEFKARKRLDYLTDCRIQNMEAVPEAVKLCMTSMISVESQVGLEAQVQTPQVTSFTTDGYSESYGKALSVEDAGKSQDELIKTMLWGETDDNGIPLLYRGLT